MDGGVCARTLKDLILVSVVMGIRLEKITFVKVRFSVPIIIETKATFTKHANCF